MTDRPISDPVPPESRDSAPAELFMHALLDFRRLDTPVIQDLRIRRAMDAIRAEPDLSPIPILRSRFRLPRIILSAAASLALLAGGVYYFASTEPRAMALVEASLSASASTSDIRRYEVRTSTSNDAPASTQATLDVGSDRRFVIRATAPDGAHIAGGRGEAEWAVRPDNSIDRTSARTWWPRWIFLLDESLTGSPDDILDRVRRDYEPQLDDIQTIDGVECRHIRATLRSEPRPLSPDAQSALMQPGAQETARPDLDPQLRSDREPRERHNGPEDMPRPRRGPSPRDDDRVRDREPRDHRDGPPGDEPDHMRPPHRRPGGPGPDDLEREPGRPGPRGPRHFRPFVPPDVIAMGPMRSRLPASIDLWIEKDTFVLRKLVAQWDGPRPQPPQRPGMPPHPRPPSRLEFRLVATETPPEGDAWFEPESHQPESRDNDSPSPSPR
jgi:hypothetical protein